MPEVLVIESLGNGQAKELQEMDLDQLPRQGELFMLSVGSVTAKFVVEAIIHKVALGKKNKIVMRVRALGVQQMPAQPNPSVGHDYQLPQHTPQQQQHAALPPGPLEGNFNFNNSDDYYPR